jgi:hypothetical protein
LATESIAYSSSFDEEQHLDYAAKSLPPAGAGHKKSPAIFIAGQISVLPSAD